MLKSILHLFLALVYLKLIRDEEYENNKFPLCNMTFAPPMFGNMALKYWFEENCHKFERNMFHFVYADDIVPGSLYANYAFNQLLKTFQMRLILQLYNNGLIISRIISRILQRKTNADSKEMRQLKGDFSRILQIVKEKDKNLNRKGEDQPFYFGENVYVPIGQYFLLKNDDEGLMKLYELDGNPEIVGHHLSRALGNLSDLDQDNLVKDHTAGGTQDSKSNI